MESNKIKEIINRNNINSKISKAKQHTEPKRKIFKNVLKAFLVGGVICLLGEMFYQLFNDFLSEELANNYTLILLIMTSAVLTGLGIYDKLGQFAGCGSIIPITGFANSMTSSAIESHSEGLVLGVINNVFKLAGSVIVTAVMMGVITGIIRYLGGVILG